MVIILGFGRIFNWFSSQKTEKLFGDNTQKQYYKIVTYYMKYQEKRCGSKKNAIPAEYRNGMAYLDCAGSFAGCWDFK